MLINITMGAAATVEVFEITACIARYQYSVFATYLGMLQDSQSCSMQKLQAQLKSYKTAFSENYLLGNHVDGQFLNLQNKK